MIYSMTGFARETSRTRWGELCWELRSVNHRYLDVHQRLPEDFRALEPQVREAVSTRLGRGKVECQLRFQPLVREDTPLTINDALVAKLGQACERVSGALRDAAPVSPVELLRWPGVVEEPERDVEPLMEEALRLLGVALESLAKGRAAEGERIAEMLSTRLDGIGEHAQAIRDRLPGVREAIRERLETRLAELGVDADPGRLEQEMAMVAQKMDVAEELDRLDSHIQEVRAALERKEPVGRRLDFLMQEFNREANTLASKSQDAETTRVAVEIKVLVEQMREQVQNVE
ncbi:MAG TPA: YicC/YloC family endoribonuclease [Gammaproteobacteria bacterium]|nr:YicC/YloC family endoribonuclease [Gammaproteobacteria bacterium]